MDRSDKDKLELEKRNDNNPMSYHSPNMPADWRFSGVPMNLVPTDNVMAVGSSSCSSAPMVDSFSQTIWDHATNSPNFGVCDIDVQNNANSSSSLRIRKGSPASLRGSIDRPVDMGWNPPSSMLKGGIFLPNMPGVFLQSFSQFPTDLGFIERAARFSSFSGGNFSDMVSNFIVPDAMGLNAGGGGMMQGPEEALAGSGLKLARGSQSQKNELNVDEASKDASLSVEYHGATTNGSPLKNDRKSGSLVRSHEAKQGVGGSGNESDEAEFSGGSGGGGGHDEQSALEGTAGEPPAKGLTSKKRKRNVQDTELDQARVGQVPGEAAKDDTENQQKGDQNPASTIHKTSGKLGKQGSQTSDPPKEEYIHVRARRGQATNSHSLAERVRREKISERMKFLQDLVPGCSKVTGKAVMLDEIINYVQSLQRQVEFLSMKLAAVNPQLDFNVEGLLAKDILQSGAGPSSNLGFSPDIPIAYPPVHPFRRGLIQASLPAMGSPSDILRRSINSQVTPMTGGFKEPSQVTNWEDELHNVVHMNYATSAPLDSQDVNGSGLPDHTKVEH